MKNKLTDLNNHLFEQLERLNDEELAGEKLKDEINRARTLAAVSAQIIKNGRLALDAKQFEADYSYEKPTGKIPEFLESEKDEETT